MLDITRDKPIKVAVRVAVPVKDHPKFNFVGKLLGPKGNSLKRLQEDTMCKMAVLGRGSMKDRQKEEELRMSGDPKFSHLAEDLHVEISAFATPAEAHARIAYALAEVRRFLVPDYNDDIRQEQMLEMQILSTQQQQQSAAGHSRRLTPPDSSRSGSEETLPILDNQMGVNSIQVQSQQQSSAQQAHHQNVPHQNGHDMSNEDLTQQHHHVLANPQITPHGVLVNAQNGGHLVTQDGRSLIQAQSANGAHILAAQNGLLGGQPDAILGLNSPLLGQAVNGVQPTLVALNGGPSGGPQVLHPALRGLKPTAVQPLNNQVGAVLGGRKRPLLGGAAGGPGRSCMSPTKRTVMSLLARARAAQAKNQPAWRGGPEHATLVPLLREDFLTGVGVNINLA